MKKVTKIIVLLMALIIIASCDSKSHVRENLTTRDAIFTPDVFASEDYTSDIIMRFGDRLLTDINSNEAHNEPFKIKSVLKGNYNEYQHYWMNYAWNRWHDKEFMVMMKAENGLLNHDRQSVCRDDNGVREPSFGFCQTHKDYHPEIVKDPRFFSDPAWQLEQCKRLWDGGTAFYGYINVTQREKARKHFDFN